MSEKAIKKVNSRIIAAGTVVGGAEYSGNLKSEFDFHDETDRFGQDTWEKAESEMQKIALATAIKKSGFRVSELGALFAGDLLNQCVGSAYGLIDYDVPYFGLYGACSTSAEGLMPASLLTSGGNFSRAGAVTSSHNCSAERQYRTPLEYGGQRPPTAQWTATACGADGLMIEVHNDPTHARSDGAQSLTPDAFRDVMNAVNAVRPFACR